MVLITSHIFCNVLNNDRHVPVIFIQSADTDAWYNPRPTSPTSAHNPPLILALHTSQRSHQVMRHRLLLWRRRHALYRGRIPKLEGWWNRTASYSYKAPTSLMRLVLDDLRQRVLFPRQAYLIPAVINTYTTQLPPSHHSDQKPMSQT